MADDYRPLRPGPSVPRSSILHPERAYVPSHQTDLRATFDRIRAELAAAKPANVRAMKARKA